MWPLRVNTTQTITWGPFLSPSTGEPVTSLTVPTGTITRWNMVTNAFSSATNYAPGGTWSHIGLGMYRGDILNTDIASNLEIITITFGATSSYVSTPHYFQVLHADQYDPRFRNSPRLAVNLEAWRGTQPTALDANSRVDASVGFANAVAAAAANKIADHVLRRTYANARASADGDTLAFRTLIGALSKLINKAAPSGDNTKLQHFHEDDATLWWEETISSDAAAVPIIGLDPI